jgi:hypothetical protein
VTRAPEAATAGIALLHDPPRPPLQARPPDGPGAAAGGAARPPLLPGTVATALIAAVIAGLAFWIRYRLLTNGGGLGGDNRYDDGVYYAAADALVHGRLPYRDFLFLQPPGIALVLAPVAWLGSVTSDPHGIVIGRTAFLALGSVNAVLVAAICRRFGPAAAIVAGVGYAVFHPAAYAERTMLLEPVGTAGLLVALLLTQGRPARSRVAVALAGAALGLAVATKIWYIVPAVLVALLLRDRRALVLAGGFTATLAAAVLPFLAAAPTAFVRQVVVDQLTRIPTQVWPPARRLASMLALRTEGHLVLLKLAVLLLVIIVLAVLALTMPEARRYVVLSAAAVAVLLASPSYFTHYGALLSPPLAITVGAGVQRLIRLLRRTPLQVALVTLALLGFALLNRHIDTDGTSVPIPAAALRPAAARVTGCVTSNDPIVLAELNVLSRDFRRGCEVWIDVTALTYDRDKMTHHDGSGVPRHLNPRWQRDLRAYLLSGDAVIVNSHGGSGLTKAALAALGRGEVLARSGRWVLHAVAPG